jgi:hypothetical protein
VSGARIAPGSGEANVATGVPLLDHLLTELAAAGRFDLSLEIDPGSLRPRSTPPVQRSGRQLRHS